MVVALGLFITGGWKKDAPMDMRFPSFEASKNLPLVILTSKGKIHQKTGEIEVPERLSLWHGGTKITADTLCYSPETQSVTAKGHVEILHANGTLVHSDDLQFHFGEGAGEMNKVRLFSAEKQGFTAQKIQYKGTTATLTMGSFTPCGLCKDQLDPLWSIHAKEMVLDTKKKRTEYTDAHLSMGGIPIFYLPYFSTATARSSGFLLPKIGMNFQIGDYVGIPYFWAMDGQHDITFTPYITGAQGNIFATQYRAHTQKYKILLEGAVNPHWENFSKDFSYDFWDDVFISRAYRSSPPKKKLVFEGFFHGKTRYNLNDTWRFSGEQWWVSEKSFLETRPFFGQTQAAFLPSHATLEGFGNRHYWKIRSLNYQGLQSYDRQRNMPFILPEINHEYTSEPLAMGGALSLRSQMLSVYRAQGNRVQRFHVDGQWDWSHITPLGQKIDLFMASSNTLYAIIHEDFLIKETPRRHTTSAQIFPQWGATLRWPWMVEGLGTLEPMVQVLIGPENTTPPVPNEDSQSLIFDNSNFWAQNRFSGYDRWDQSSRVNYGLDWICPVDRSTFHVFLGQSYALGTPDPLLKVVGIRPGPSDYVGQVDRSSDSGSMIYRFRLDATNMHFKFHELGWMGGPSWAKFSGSYAFGKSDKAYNLTGYASHYNQVVLKTLSKIREHWTVKSFATYNFCNPDKDFFTYKDGYSFYGRNERWMDMGMGIGYQDECFSAEIILQRSSYNLEKQHYGIPKMPGWSLSFFLQFKGMGGGGERDIQRFDHGIHGGW